MAAKSSSDAKQNRGGKNKINGRHTDDFDQVLHREAGAINERRKFVSQSSPTTSTGLPDDVVGLALSGGGIRAASIGLGALQALYASKHFAEIDYLSTVSGGGYIGAYLSSAAVKSTIQEALAVRNTETPATGQNNGQNPKPEDFGQPPLVQRFIFGGKYLYRPWEAANKYLIGLLLTNLLFFSGLVMVGAVIALLWRSLDYNGVRDFLDLFYLNSGFFTAFLPFYVVLACWIIAWLLSYFKLEAEAPGTWAQRWLYATVATFSIGVVMLLVNSETRLGFLDVFFGEKKVENQSDLTKWLLGLVGAGLTPFLAPKRLLKAGLNPQTIWQRATFHVAMFALLIGVPLSVVGIVGMPNISGTATDPDGNIRAGDIRDWPAFSGICDHAADRWSREPLNVLTTVLAEKKIIGDADEAAMVAMRPSLQSIATLEQRIKHFANRSDQLDPSLWARFAWLVGWPVTHDNPLRDFWIQQRALDARKERFCKKFSEEVLAWPLLPFVLTTDPSGGPPDTSGAKIENAADSLKSGFERVREAVKNVYPKALDNDSDLAETFADAELCYRSGVWTRNDAKEFNLILLRALHPECFYTDGKVYRDLVIAGDQVTRLWILGVALVIFVVAALFVNLNATSLHRFYRNRLREAYFVPDSNDSRPDFELSGLNTTAKGAPYHLINATIDLNRPENMDKIDAECRNPEADRRDVQTFVFSQLYSGCDATGWACTEHYEKFRKDNINVADAIALSGAAIDPLRVSSFGLGMAMLVLNLNLGQWMPNPRYEKPRLKPNFFALFKDWLFKPVTESTYCHVSDGGFTDNLGVMSLLRRRCRLIIALDAGCDSKGMYSDLNWLIRAARIRYGIEILQPVEDATNCEAMNTLCFDLDDKGYCQRHFALARIKYPEAGAKDAWLVYLKPSFTGDEGADLLKYRLEDPDFPNDDTANQFYEPIRVESYRRIGFHMTESFCNMAKPYISDRILTGMAGLEKAVVEEQLDAAARTKLKRELPAAVPKALRLAEKILASLRKL